MSCNTLSSASTSRVVFIDQARALAIVLMLFGHSFDRFLGEPWRSGPAYTNYQFFRGISSALFILLAGFSFSVATLPKCSEYLSLTPKLIRRFRRIGLILLLGFILQLWAPTLALSLEEYSLQKLEHLFAFNVLQNIGFGLALLHILLFSSRQPSRFVWTAGFACLGAFGLSTITYRTEIDQHLPLPLAAMANLYHESHFPLIPYVGYTLAGSVLGALYLSARARCKEPYVMTATALVGAGLIGVEIALRKYGVEVFPFTTPKAFMPGFTFARAGTAMILVVLFYFLTKIRVLFEKSCKIMSIDSLAIYFTHLLLVYGCASFPGLFPSFSRGMNPWQMWTWNFALLVSMYLMAKAISYFRETRPTLLSRVRQFILIALGLNFFTAPQLHPLWIVCSLILSASIMFALRKGVAYVS